MNDNKGFQYVEYDLNGIPIRMGEVYENGIKNGQWRNFDTQGRLSAILHYQHDTLQGMATYFHFDNPDIPLKEEGLLVNSKRNGIWVAFEQSGKNRWRRTMYSVYNAEEEVIAKILFHPNDKIAVEIYMDADGNPHYYKQFDKKGNLIFKGEELPLVAE
ncbi:hypothetical protein Q0590_00155 [Rhodocytophaga aerolata]|uniref:Toxin-antitoxin system YwqK family antitoxin n=1 Tax=Rhodocytophaga aerolata TaxID=455078 RepID=A0ABT8QXS5_9BACT|nr:hypothetical protein [Rhodocytophaga aerolata]MDO1444636.1 hypothetical protein [Rhodocytophaga aerolata]